jgi:acyl-homoserine-lactone acylase
MTKPPARYARAARRARPRASHTRILGAFAVAALCAGCASGGASSGGRSGGTVPLHGLAGQVEIRRTSHGVPQIHAENLRAGAFALAWVQLEDHGESIIRNMHAARGRMALVEGAAFIDADARNRLRHARAAEMFRLLHEDTRDVYVGFAEGINHFIRLHAATLPAWMRPDFAAVDVFSRDVNVPAEGAMSAFRRRLEQAPGDAALLVRTPASTWERSAHAGQPRPDNSEEMPPELLDEAQNVGSNAWALAPSRTTSGRAILLRNPHLAWTAGYYEAHLRVPGKLDFYGDFRIGGPFSVIGGFNRYLGFSTTNNASRSHEFYALRLDPARADHVVLDGASHPLRRETVIVDYVEAGRTATAIREFWSTHLGPVVHRNDSLVYLYRPAANGEYRAGEQWLKMMQAESLAEWQDAMRIGARTTSNFTYADRAGNIFYVWMTQAPILPHPPGGDSLAILATRSTDVWQRVASFDELPQLHNPPGGYVRNENDSPHYTSMHRVLPDSFAFEVEAPSLRLRSQHGIQLLDNDRRFSLEDVVETKHSMRMLLADRVKPDLIAAVRGAAANSPSGEVGAALEMLVGWDNTVAAGSRGGVLFETWWSRYRSLLRGVEPHAVPWNSVEPLTTPRGLADPRLAAEAFDWAVTETARAHGGWDVTWGDVHRVRRGTVDVPVGGCGGALGCFRVLNFSTEADGRRVVNGGDGWVIAVEFGDEPRAFSVLGYGQSPDPASPFHADQAALFAAGRMKPVRWSEAEIEAALIARYRPGMPGVRR